MDRLRAENISKSYGGEKIIENINIRLCEKETAALLGVSGTGKTTLLNVLSGLTQPDCGRVYLSGRDITGTAGNISYMQQKDLLLPHLTVLENVALPLIIKGKSKKEAKQEAQKNFEAFGLSGTEKKYPSALSGGMRQRAALLRAYMLSGDIVLLDEPFGALDAITKAAVHKWYLEITHRLELSTLFITHDIDEAILLSERIYIMGEKPGRIIGEITIDAPKPRSDEFMLDTGFLTYKREIIENMKSI